MISGIGSEPKNEGVTHRIFADQRIDILDRDVQALRKEIGEIRSFGIEKSWMNRINTFGQASAITVSFAGVITVLFRIAVAMKTR